MPLTFGIIGAGRVGSNFARLVTQHGHIAVIANSRGPESLAGLVAELGPLARAATPAEAADAADFGVLAIPFLAVRDLPAAQLAGTPTIDATTYYAGRDGDIPELQAGRITAGEYLQALLPGVPLVRALTHVTAAELPRDGRPHGSADRRAFALTGEFAGAKARVAELFDELGYDTLDAGPLSESWRYDPFTPASGAAVGTDGLRTLLAQAEHTTR
ncbi:MAG TPA: NAD(P)-binding domain-containing protein [Gryllotalpicola sp.]